MEVARGDQRFVCPAGSRSVVNPRQARSRRRGLDRLLRSGNFVSGRSVQRSEGQPCPSSAPFVSSRLIAQPILCFAPAQGLPADPSRPAQEAPWHAPTRRTPRCAEYNREESTGMFLLRPATSTHAVMWRNCRTWRCHTFSYCRTASSSTEGCIVRRTVHCYP